MYPKLKCKTKYILGEREEGETIIPNNQRTVFGGQWRHSAIG